MATDHSTSQAATGVESTTPATANRPGLPALAYRAGTHGSFYATMQARLASVFVDAPFDEVDEHGVRRQGVDRGFVLSDHADWPGLQCAIRSTGAERIILTHGYEAVMVRWLREQGLQAGSFRTAFGDEPAAPPGLAQEG